jgi:hypothetical protein
MKSILIFIPFLIIIFSCADPVQEINWKTSEIPAKLVVEGSVTTDYGLHPLTLKISDEYFASRPAKTVSNAQVILKDGKNEMVYEESDTMQGLYYPQEAFMGTVGSNYELEINLETGLGGSSTYTANSSIIQGMEIDSITADLYINPVLDSDEDSLVVIVMLYGMEPGNIENYYMIKYYRNGEILSDTVNSWFHFNDRDYDINGDNSMGFFLEEEYFEGDTLSLELFSIPKNYELYLEAVGHIAEPGDPFGFSGPPANAIGNVNDGQALGYFFGAHVSSSTTIVLDRSYD